MLLPKTRTSTWQVPATASTSWHVLKNHYTSIPRHQRTTLGSPRLRALSWTDSMSLEVWPLGCRCMLPSGAQATSVALTASFWSAGRANRPMRQRSGMPCNIFRTGPGTVWAGPHGVPDQIGHFDLELCPESENWVDQKNFTFWVKPPLWVKVTPVQRG